MSNNKDPKSFNNPGRPSLVSKDVSSVGNAVLTLTNELWVMQDRLAVMEAVLAEKGFDISNEIERYQPSDEMQKKLDQQGQKLAERILKALSGE